LAAASPEGRGRARAFDARLTARCARAEKARRRVAGSVKQVEAFTDGACRGNPGPGGWGALLRHAGKTRELWGGEAATTNNRMELTAAIRALEALKEPCQVAVYTDSTYVRNGIMQWLPRWKARGWKTADRKPVKNQ